MAASTQFVVDSGADRLKKIRRSSTNICRAKDFLQEKIKMSMILMGRLFSYVSQSYGMFHTEVCELDFYLELSRQTRLTVDVTLCG